MKALSFFSSLLFLFLHFTLGNKFSNNKFTKSIYIYIIAERVEAVFRR